ncbi:MAG: bifunctional nuclease domain-containing protein [Alkalispirochaeta sp.]
MKNIMLVEAEIWTVARTDKGNAVLVKPVGSDRAVPIFIGQLEAQSILFGLAGVPVPRPMTHDLFISVLEKSNMSVERVEITDLKDRTFYSRLVIKQGLKRIVVDSRPSDSLGIASRVHCPVYIAESIVDEAGVAVNLITDEEVPFEGMETHDEGASSVSTETTESAPMDERTRLEALLQKAVDEENYEEAARIRDRIQGL